MYYILLSLPVFYLLTYVNYYCKLLLFLLFLFVSICKNIDINKIQSDLALLQLQSRAANRFRDFSVKQRIEKENELFQLFVLGCLLLSPLLGLILFFLVPNFATTCVICLNLYQS
jgi:hypothetical protein